MAQEATEANPDAETPVAGVPENAEPVEGVPGYVLSDQPDDAGALTVYGPDGAVVARLFGRPGHWSAMIDEVRIPLSGYLGSAPQIIARHHLASRDPSKADRVQLVWTEHKGAQVVAVRGTIKDNARDREAVRAASGMKWSPIQGGYITGTNWKPETRDDKVARILAAFARQGRNVQVIDEQVAAAASTSADGPGSGAEPVQPPDVESMSDEEISQAVTRAHSVRTLHGSRHREPLSVGERAVFAERRRRIRQRLDEHAAVADLDDEALTEFVTWTGRRLDSKPGLLSEDDGEPEVQLARDLRRVHDEATVEKQQRIVRDIQQRPPVADIGDEALEQERRELITIRDDGLDDDDRTVISDRRDAVESEQNTRKARQYRDRPAVADLDDEALAVEFLELFDPRARSGAPVVSEAVKERLEALGEEQNRRSSPEVGQRLTRAVIATADRYTTSGASVEVDGYRYGKVCYNQHASTNAWHKFEKGWNAQIGYGGKYLGPFPSEVAAVAALVDNYDQDPATEPMRLYGRQYDLWVPKMFAELYHERRRDDLKPEASKERRTLAEMFRSTYGWSDGTNPITKKIGKGRNLEVPEGLLAEFQRVAEELSEQMMLQANDRQAEPSDRSWARSRLKAINAALHAIDTTRQQVRDNGGNDDRKAISREDIEAQQAALRAGLGEDEDDEHLHRDGADPLGDPPSAGTGTDERPGDVHPNQGPGDSGRGLAGRTGSGGDPGRRAGLPGAGGAAEADPGDRARSSVSGTAAAPGERDVDGDADGGPAGTGTGSEVGRAAGDPGRAQPGPAGGRLAGAEPAGSGLFRPDPAGAPVGPQARAAANLEAIRVVQRLNAERRAANQGDKQVLARWSGWGSVPVVFADEPDPEHPAYQRDGARYGKYAGDHAEWMRYDETRQGLRDALGPLEWARAARSTLSAHYTPQGLAEAMWDGMLAFGFDGGEVLDSGCGAGIYTGTAPDGARMTGVELDPWTARIAAKLYPHATILAESFAETDIEAGTFDAAIGNVPFADIPFTDRRYGGGLSIHNGFIVKNLALMRPGTIQLVVASTGVMDAKGTKAREQISAYGDLIAAWRLPAGTFADTAGTLVTVDVLAFRRRADGQEPADTTWIQAPARDINGTEHTLNAYYDQYPDHILGTLTTRSTAYGPKLTVQGDPDRSIAQLRDRLVQAGAAAQQEGRGYQPHPLGPDRPPLEAQTARAKHAGDYTGRLYQDDAGQFWQHINGDDPAKVNPADGRTDQLRALLDLRDVAAELRELDRSDTDPDRAARAEQLRARLRELHAAYTAAFGPLSRPRQPRIKTVDGQAAPTAWGWFRDDPDAATVLALETWDTDRGEPRPSRILIERASARPRTLTKTDDPKAAVDAVVAARGHVDLDAIAQLLDLPAQEALQKLGTEVFTDPETGRLEPAVDYLSGPVREKLERARQAASEDPAFAVNVRALEAVQPPERTIGQFTPDMGAHWNPPELVQGFLREYLGDRTLTVSHNPRYGWILHAGTVPKAQNAAHGVLPDEDAGTRGKSALAIAKALLGYGKLTVYHDENDKDVDEQTTRLVRQKAEAMNAAYGQYVTATSGRLSLLTESFNRIMNGHVVPSYDGRSPTLEGLTPERTPHWWQLSGSARMQREAGTIIAHEVSLGKTDLALIGAQALVRTGQITKPFAVCQDNNAQQWYAAARFLYPNAKVVLITSDTLAGGDRNQVLEWLRANTFDLVIFTEPAFASIKITPEAQEEYIFRELEALKEQVKRERDLSHPFARAALERRLAYAEARINRNAAPLRKPGEVYWDELGFDYGVIDEAHRFKGVGFRSKEGGGDTATLRGIDLHQKLDQMHRRNQGRRPTVTLLTGTPYRRSITEQFTMMSLAAPWILERYGVASPDLWAGTYGRKVLRVEMTPDGSGFRAVERFAEFRNRAAMKIMWAQVADTKRREDVGMPGPTIKGGGPNLVMVEPTKDQRARMRSFVERSRLIHAGEVTRDEDNMLKVSSEAVSVAIDPRLLDPDAPPGNKLALAADLAYQRWLRTKDNVYKYEGSDEDHPVPGGLQLMFLDEGVPGGNNKGGFDAYAEIRRLVVAKGMPAEKVTFFHDHLDPARPEKLARFRHRANNGEYSLVIGSTPTMSTGINMQNRALSVTHVDISFNAADMEQKNGRVYRYGNQNSEIEIDILATRGTMDAWKFGFVAAKQIGLLDIQRPYMPEGDNSDIVAEIDGGQFDYETMEAEIGGNPHIADLMKTRRALKDLEIDQHNQAAERIRRTELLAELRQEAADTAAGIEQRAAALPRITNVHGDDFAMTVDGVGYDDRGEAARALHRQVTNRLLEHQQAGFGPWRTVGGFGGLDVAVRAELAEGAVLRAHVGFPDLRGSAFVLTMKDLQKKRAGAGMITRLSNALDKAPAMQDADRDALPGLDEQVAFLENLQASADLTALIEHTRARVHLLEAVVGAVTERDKVPELEDADFGPATDKAERKRMIAQRAQQRRPLQAAVDAAAAELEKFDRHNPTPARPEQPLQAPASFTPASEPPSPQPIDQQPTAAATEQPPDAPEAAQADSSHDQQALFQPEPPGDADALEPATHTAPIADPAPEPPTAAAEEADQPIQEDLDADVEASTGEPGNPADRSPTQPPATATEPTQVPEPAAEPGGDPAAEPPLPVGMTPERRDELVEAMTMLAPAMFHAGAGDPARYAAEGIDNTLAHGDTPVTREEWDWAEAWAQLHPEIADGDRNGIAIFFESRRARVEAVAQAHRDDAQRISTQASQAWKAGDSDRAHQLIEEGERLYPDNPVWERARTTIRQAAQTREPTAPSPEPAATSIDKVAEIQPTDPGQDAGVPLAPGAGDQQVPDPAASDPAAGQTTPPMDAVQTGEPRAVPAPSGVDEPDVMRAALALHDAGLSVVPAATDGTKRPRGSGWKQYQAHRMDRAELARQLRGGHPGVGVITGAVSGGLEMLELEGRAVDQGVLDELEALADASGLGELWRRLRDGYCEQSPTGGVHLLYRLADAEVPGNTKLAQTPARREELTAKQHRQLAEDPARVFPRALIETRGEGGFVVVAPSHGKVHPSGQPYRLLSGSPSTIPTITDAERQALHHLCRTFDRMPAPEPAAAQPQPTKEPSRRAADPGVSPGDDFEARADWSDILGPHGWTHVHTSGTTRYWRRPNKRLGVSATTGHSGDRDRLYVFSSSTEFTPETPYTKFGAFTALEHGGDFSAAAKALRAAGYGDSVHRPQAARQLRDQQTRNRRADPARRADSAAPRTDEAANAPVSPEPALDATRLDAPSSVGATSTIGETERRAGPDARSEPGPPPTRKDRADLARLEAALGSAPDPYTTQTGDDDPTRLSFEIAVVALGRISDTGTNIRHQDVLAPHISIFDELAKALGTRGNERLREVVGRYPRHAEALYLSYTRRGITALTGLVYSWNIVICDASGAEIDRTDDVHFESWEDAQETAHVLMEEHRDSTARLITGNGQFTVDVEPAPPPGAQSAETAPQPTQLATHNAPDVPKGVAAVDESPQVEDSMSQQPPASTSTTASLSLATRIRIDERPARPTVRGTRPSDTQLRKTLRKHGFEWRRPRQLWEYTGSTGGKSTALQAVRDTIAKLDHAEPAAPEHEGGSGHAEARTDPSPEPAKQRLNSYPPTAEQAEIGDAVVIQKLNVAVPALAGTGKSATLRQIAERVAEEDPSASIVYFAFNKDTAEEAEQIFGSNVQASTINSYANRQMRSGPYADKIRRLGKGIQQPEQIAKLLNVAPVEYLDHDGEPMEMAPTERARLALAAVSKYRESTDERISAAHLPAVLTMNYPSTEQPVLETAQEIWANIADPSNAQLLDGKEPSAIQFGHDDYFKLWALSNPRVDADLIFFDEAQDCNPVQAKVIRDQPIQTVVVGDTQQSIYGFRGAKDALVDWPADITLPLTQSFRFGPEIATRADAFLRLLDAPRQLRGNPALASTVGSVENPDAILCRTNVGAVTEVVNNLRGGKRVALLGGGKEIYKLARAARDLKAGRGTKHPDLSRFTNWIQVEEAAKEERALQSLVRLIDKYDPDELQRTVRELTDENATGAAAPDVTVSTVHRAKGREWNYVRVGNDFIQPIYDDAGRIRSLPPKEALNASYVAITRARLGVSLGSLEWIDDVAVNLPSRAPSAGMTDRRVEADHAQTTALASYQPEPRLPSPAPKPDPAHEPAAVATEHATPPSAAPAIDPATRPFGQERGESPPALPVSGQADLFAGPGADAEQDATPAAPVRASGSQKPRQGAENDKAIVGGGEGNAARSKSNDVIGPASDPKPEQPIPAADMSRPAAGPAESVPGPDAPPSAIPGLDDAFTALAEASLTEPDDDDQDGDPGDKEQASVGRAGTRPGGAVHERTVHEHTQDLELGTAVDGRGEPDVDQPLDATSDPFGDIRARFEELKRALADPGTSIDLAEAIPALHGPVIPPRTDTARPRPSDLPVGVEDELQDSLTEAHAHLGHHASSQDWQRITAIVAASRDLGRTILGAAGSYRREVAQDLRIHGLWRTVTARCARTISTSAYALARGIDTSGSRAVRALRKLARKAADYADRLTGVLPAGRRLVSTNDLERGWTELEVLLDGPAGRHTDRQPWTVQALDTSVTAMRQAWDTAAGTVGTAVTSTPAWQRLTTVWNHARSVVDKVHQGALSFERDAYSLGLFTATWARTCETLAWGARQALEHLRARGVRHGIQFQALRLLNHTAEETVAHLRGRLPRGEHADLGAFDPPILQAERPAPTRSADTSLHTDTVPPERSAVATDAGPSAGLLAPSTQPRISAETKATPGNDRDAVFEELISVLDAIDYARQHGELTGGFAQVGKLTEEAAARLGLTRTGAPDEPFSPDLHDAAGIVPDAVAPADHPIVGTILRPGYSANGRVIRPASVMVIQPKEHTSAATTARLLAATCGHRPTSPDTQPVQQARPDPTDVPPPQITNARDGGLEC